MPDLKNILYDSYITNLLSQVIITLIVVLWLKTKDKWLFFIRFFHYIAFCITRKKVVLFWCDNEAVSKKWSVLYKHRLKNIHFQAVKSPGEFLRYKLTSKHIICVIMMNTDVSKISLNEAQSEKIQKHLTSYVQKGGVLLSTHDSIYRRVRNTLLENEYRCQIINFQRDEKPIEYIIKEEYINCPLFKNLPSSFFLSDGEVCWGNWGIDVKTLCYSRKLFDHRKSIPLFTFVKSSNGGFFWINSGDTFEKPCDSVNTPDAPLITIVDNLITNRNEILSFLQK